MRFSDTMENFWQKIQSGLQRVGDFQARLILTLLYTLFAIPVGLFLRFNSGQPKQGHDPQAKTTYWQPRTHEAISLNDAQRQG